MSQEPTDVLSVPTPHGRAEARHMGRTGSGQGGPWQVRFPWGTETFFGTAADIVGHMRMRIAQQEGSERSRKPA